MTAVFHVRRGKPTKPQHTSGGSSHSTAGLALTLRYAHRSAVIPCTSHSTREAETSSPNAIRVLSRGWSRADGSLTTFTEEQLPPVPAPHQKHGLIKFPTGFQAWWRLGTIPVEKQMFDSVAVIHTLKENICCFPLKASYS